MTNVAAPEGVEIRGPVEGRFAEILSREALEFLAALHRQFNPTREQLLAARKERSAALEAGGTLDFLPETAEIREGDWKVGPIQPDFADRRTEITGPTERKMLINALNSGARCFMADFEDANTPTWANMVGGQANLIDAIERTISFTSPEGKEYKLNDKVAILVPRPRGWHLVERHLLVDGTPISGSLFDFGLCFFHTAKRLLERGSGPYYYLPKMEHHLEARLWNDIFTFAEERLGIEHGTIKATVLIETLPAAFQMDEILYELRDHSAGLNAGRWDYMFSMIKSFRLRPEFLLPDRNSVTMTVPFMRSYSELLVQTCHKRGAFAMGGMAAFIPSRKDAEVNATALAKVTEDKCREATIGFDGTWVAHPDTVATAMEQFDQVLGDRPNQIDKQLPDVSVSAADLLNTEVPGGKITEEGLRNDVSVGLQYLEAWLRGSGAVGVFNLMEDVATAEISRSQIWQWVHQEAKLDEGPTVTKNLVREIEEQELAKVRERVGEDTFNAGRFKEAKEIFEEVALSDEFVEFLTLAAYDYID